METFKPYEAIYRWDAGFTPMKEYDGQLMIVLRPCRVPDEVDQEVGPMFLAGFEDGMTQHVYVDEIVPL